MNIDQDKKFKENQKRTRRIIIIIAVVLFCVIVLPFVVPFLFIKFVSVNIPEEQVVHTEIVTDGDNSNNKKVTYKTNSTEIKKEITKEDGFNSIEEYEQANKDSFKKVKETKEKAERIETAQEKIQSIKEQSVQNYHQELLKQQGLKSDKGELIITKKGDTEVSSKESKEIDKDGKEIVKEEKKGKKEEKKDAKNTK